MSSTVSGRSQPEVSSSALRVVSALLRFRHLVLWAPLVAVVTTAAVSVLLPRTYTVRASFLPRSLGQADMSSLSGITAQLGLGGVGPGNALGSPDFYKKLLETQTILGDLADSHFDIPEGHPSLHGTLAETWNIRAQDPRLRRDLVVRRLRRALTVRVEPRVQLTEVEVVTASPELSRAIVERLLELANRFNLERRQSQSAQEARFVRGRLIETRRELKAAEDSVERFMQRNRDFRSSPGLQFQYERLQREVALRQTVYAALSQRYEQSRIDEVRDTPVLTVVEEAVTPARPDSRRLSLKLVVSLFAGTLIGVFAALAAQFAARGAESVGDELAALNAALADARADLRRPWRLLLGRG